MTDGVTTSFEPALWLPGRHLQTIVPALWPPPALHGPVEALEVPVAEGTRVRVDLTLPGGAPRGTLLLIHGLGGDAGSSYMIRTTRFARARGWAVARMNLRTCGGTEALSRTLYNAGQSDDAGAVLAALDAARLPRPFAAAGFSLGGNLLLRYAGVSGSGCLADTVAGVNAPVDLDACLSALERPGNAIYEASFVLALCRQIRRLRKIRPIPGPSANWARIRRLRRFDDLFTAPDAGYPSAAAYYAGASASPLLGGVRVPMLVLSAQNDPFVPFRVFDAARRLAPPSALFAHPRVGGHVGFWQRRGERFWAAEALLSFFEERVC